jgi:signal transduction histidine kinase
VLSGCVSGYASVYPARRFELRLVALPAPLEGSPELFAQMLDKLAANAADFSSGDDPVRIALEHQGEQVLISMSNAGPLLPADMQGRLFEAMVSVRGQTSGDPHLGLGLYIARLIPNSMAAGSPPQPRRRRWRNRLAALPAARRGVQYRPDCLSWR